MAADPYTPPATNGTADESLLSRAYTEAQRKTEESWKARLIDAPASWYSEQPPKRDWLFRDARHPKARGVFPLGKVGQVIAEGGAGKTMFLCQLAVAVATGSTWAGALSVATPGRVLLVLGEEDRDEAQRRLFRAARSARDTKSPEPGAIVVLPLAGEACPMLEHNGDGNLVETDWLRWFRGYVKSGNFRLVGIDPLSRFAGPTAESDNAAGTRFVQALESLVSPTLSVLNAHHVNKLSRGQNGRIDASSGRGSSSLVDGPRWQCALSIERLDFEAPEDRERLGEVVTLTVTKSNYAPKPEPVSLRRDADNGGALLPIAPDDLERIERARNASLLESPKRTARAAEKNDEAAVQDAAVLQAVTELHGITWRKLCDRVAALCNCGDFTARKAIERMANRLEVRPGPRGASTYYLRRAPT